MPSLYPNLWPANIGSQIDGSPLSVLSEQAANLSQITDGAVEGHVIKLDPGPAGAKSYRYDFAVSAPTLANSYISLFTIEIPLGAFYPVRLSVCTSGHGVDLQVISLGDFMLAMHSILRTSRTRKIIATLSSQAKANDMLSDDVPF